MVVMRPRAARARQRGARQDCPGLLLDGFDPFRGHSARRLAVQLSRSQAR